MMFKTAALAIFATLAQAQWGSINDPPCISCGNHFDEKAPVVDDDEFDFDHLNPELHAAEHLEKDELTAEKERKEMMENYRARMFAMDRYRTESMYDSLDRLDASLKKV